MPIHLRMLVATAISLSIAASATAGPVLVDQGPAWSPALRAGFYAVDQGSRMMPLAWMKALRQPDGTPFLDKALARYGFLPNGNGDDLPIGFVAAGAPAAPVVGMGCAACHTREIVAEGKVYRIDGGPAFADFGAFLGDLDAAVARTLADDAAFTTFAKQVLRARADTQAEVAALHDQVALWQARDHAWVARSLPKHRSWGPSRLDAISMIFNRLAGLDLGPGPERLIAENIAEADAPTRYPFLWNSPRQDFSQWAVFTENGNDQLALARNLGELYGVFGTFHPRPAPAGAPPGARDFLGDNSANFAGLATAEGLIRRLGPPIWPWPVDEVLASRGAAIFARKTSDGGCADCHALAEGLPRPPAADTLRTGISDVGTDGRQWRVLQRAVTTGSLEGASLAPGAPPLRARDSALVLLRHAVVGTLLQLQSVTAKASPLPPARMEGVMHMQMAPPTAGPPHPIVNAYEARVLQGIWAAAPYLHNGAVPTLADLLEPATKRPKAFRLGPAYDIARVGLAADQSAFDVTLTTTGCDDRDSGDSNCGHEYGTSLAQEEKAALLEYLKTL